MNTSADTASPPPSGDTGGQSGWKGPEPPEQVSSAAEAPNDPATIERNIDRTRDRLDRTLDELQAKFSPGQMLDKGLAYLKSNGVEFAENLGQSVKQNPLPLLLTTAGVAWLMMNSNRARGDVAPRPRGALQASETAGRAAERAGDLTGRVAQGTRNAARSVGASAGNAVDQISRSAGSAAAGVRQAVSDGSHRLADAALVTRDQGRRAVEGFARLIQEQPVLVGILAMAAGAVVGSALPPSETEDRWIGAARDEGLSQAKQAATSAYESARTTVSETIQQAPASASSAGRSAPDSPANPGSTHTH